MGTWRCVSAHKQKLPVALIGKGMLAETIETENGDMMLHFDGSWRFDSPGPIPDGVAAAFDDFINKIVAQGDEQPLLEHFKRHFAAASGRPHHASSNASWARSDLEQMMQQAAENAPLFIEAFYNACEELQQRSPRMGLPDIGIINRVLADHKAGYQIRGSNLAAAEQHAAISAPERGASLTSQAQEIIQSSVQFSEKLLSEGNYRQAVQEVLWLLETVTTAFRGIGSEEGLSKENTSIRS